MAGLSDMVRGPTTQGLCSHQLRQCPIQTYADAVDSISMSSERSFEISVV